MQETVNTITMSGETMEVFIGAGCLSDCRPGAAVRLPGIISDLCQTLSRRSVAKTFINHIRIGDTVALIDRRNNCTFRLQVNAQVFYLADAKLLRQVPNGRWAVAA